MNISDDEFAKRVFKKFDDFESKLDSTCEQLRQTQKTIDDHILTLDIKEREHFKAESAKKKRFYYLIAIVGVCSGILGHFL